jgi:hypothetical protein
MGRLLPVTKGCCRPFSDSQDIYESRGDLDPSIQVGLSSLCEDGLLVGQAAPQKF